VAETECMLSSCVGSTETICSKLKNRNSFLKPNFESLPRLRQVRQVRRVNRRFLCAHAAVLNLFNLDGHKLGAQHYRDLRISALDEWRRVVA
jgi:putative transposase